TIAAKAQLRGLRDDASRQNDQGETGCSKTHRILRRLSYLRRFIMRAMIEREQAWRIVCEFTKSENLRKHALAVEACVVAYARKFGEDEPKWSMTALLHDFDWEIHPEAPDHPMKCERILSYRDVPEDIRRAILSHATYSG